MADVGGRKPEIPALLTVDDLFLEIGRLTAMVRNLEKLADNLSRRVAELEQANQTLAERNRELETQLSRLDKERGASTRARKKDLKKGHEDS